MPNDNVVSVMVSSVDLGETELSLLKQAVEDVAARGIACSYTDSDVKGSHIVVLDGDAAEGQVAISQLKSSQVKFVLCSERMVGKNLVSVLKPLEQAVLGGLLERVMIQLQPHLTPTANASPAAPAAAPRVKIESENQQNQSIRTLFHLLYAAKVDHMMVKIVMDGLPPLLVNGEGKTIVTEANEEQQRAMMSVDSSQLQASTILLEDFPACPSDAIRVIPLDGVLWSAGLMWKTNLLMGGCNFDQAVKLKAWPNFTRNSFFPVHMKLSATLASQPMTLKTLHEMTQVPMEEIVCYFNAAYAVGLIDTNPNGANAPVAKKSMDDNRRGLLSKLAHKFGLA